MRAYRVATETRIDPFGDPPRRLTIGVHPLERWQADACAACGLELVDVAAPSEAVDRPCVVFFDDVFFTEMALRNFLADVMSRPEDAALALPAGPVARGVTPVDGARSGPEDSAVVDVFHLAGAAAVESRAALVDRCQPSLQKVREGRAEIRLPRVGGGEASVEAPLSARVAGHVKHWLHVLRLSQLAVGVTLLDRLRHEPRLMLKLRWRRRRGPWAMARALRFVHPTAQVHPTADLEAAVIGPGCVIRAHAHVHNSVLGEGVDIGDHAAVMGCTLADGVQVLRGSYLAHCAAMPRGTLANYKVQLSLFGEEVFLTSSAWLLDAKLRGEIRVAHEGRLEPIGSPFLGACLGHRVTLGAQATIQTGRAVPNGVTILGATGQVALDLGVHPEGSILTVRDGRAVPLSTGAGAEVDGAHAERIGRSPDDTSPRE